MRRITKIICDRAMAVAWVPRGCTFERSCAACGQRLALAPSGQTLLQADPTMTLLCSICFYPQIKPDTLLVVPDIETAIREAASAIPNYWRNRN